VTPKEVLALIASRSQGGRPAFMDFPACGSTSPFGRRARRRRVRGRVGFGRLQHSRLAAINESDMLVMPSRRRRFIDPFCRTPL